MRLMKMTVLLAAVLGSASALAQTQTAVSQTSSQPVSNMQELQQKLQADRQYVVSSNMQLTQAQAVKFWPVYDNYIDNLKKINQRALALITSYADDYNADTLTDAKAGALVKEMFAIEESELKLQQSYAASLGKVLPAIKVARALQIENKLRAIGKYRLAAQIPLVQ